MKPSKITSVLSLTLIATLLANAPSFAEVRPKSAGRTASSIPNTILSGKGVPSSSTGIDGDFYIDTRSLLFYGPKKAGKWPTPQSLQGAAGADGVNGKNGADGKSTVNASNVAGPSGPQGEKGEKGEPGLSGAPGAAGLPGAPGAPGIKGDTGSSGIGTPGAKGDIGNTGASGPKGETGTVGSTGPKGETGTVGSTGPKGETGTVGATGPSSIAFGTITFADISGGPGTGQPGTITGFKSGKIYFVRIKIISYQPTNNLENSMPLGITLSTTGGTPIISNQYYSIAKGNSFRSGIGSSRVEYSVDSEVVLNGVGSTDYTLNILVEAGKDTSSTSLLRLQGNYSAIEVGSITTL